MGSKILVAVAWPYSNGDLHVGHLAGSQFSKSRGHMIALPDLLSRYDPDAIRYYITVVMPEMSDSDFYWNDFYQRVGYSINPYPYSKNWAKVLWLKKSKGWRRESLIVQLSSLAKCVQGLSM